MRRFNTSTTLSTGDLYPTLNEVSLLNSQSQASFFNHLKSFMLNLITFVLKNT
jgi:hypothetical protein